MINSATLRVRLDVLSFVFGSMNWIRLRIHCRLAVLGAPELPEGAFFFKIDCGSYRGYPNSLRTSLPERHQRQFNDMSLFACPIYTSQVSRLATLN